MAMSSNQQPIIIIKKKVAGHGGHHGGAWKVAYADFVTAMMALFIVLWLLSSSEQVQKAVGGYFTDPTGNGKDIGNGLRGVGTSTLSLARKDMEKLKEKIEASIVEVSAFEKVKQNVHITVTGEGLRVELVEGDGSTFFESGSAHPTEHGREMLALLAAEIGKLPNPVTVEGHTDAKPFPGDEYSNWELSADRANAARRWMSQNGMRPNQVVQVRGFASQSLRLPEAPENPQNRRVTIIIQYAPTIPGTRPVIGQHAGEAKPAGEHGGSKPAEGKAADGKPGEAKPGEAKPGEAKPAKAKPAPVAVKSELQESKSKGNSWLPSFVADHLPGASKPAPAKTEAQAKESEPKEH